jgi:hypothetical protein
VPVTAAEPALADAPAWDWSASESLLLPLSQYERVEQLLRGCRPSLLGKGGAIPPATLAAFRCVVRGHLCCQRPHEHACRQSGVRVARARHIACATTCAHTHMHRSPDGGLAPPAEVEQRFRCMPASLRAALLPFQKQVCCDVQAQRQHVASALAAASAVWGLCWSWVHAQRPRLPAPWCVCRCRVSSTGCHAGAGCWWQTRWASARLCRRWRWQHATRWGSGFKGPRVGCFRSSTAPSCAGMLQPALPAG